MYNVQILYKIVERLLSKLKLSIKPSSSPTPHAIWLSCRCCLDQHCNGRGWGGGGGAGDDVLLNKSNFLVQQPVNLVT